jgi:hypothetical protein
MTFPKKNFFFKSMRRQFVTFTCRGLVQSFCRDSRISNKMSEQDWEDQSPLSDNAGMDMSPSPWSKHAAPVDEDDDDDISADEALLALQNLDLSDFQKLQAMQAKNKALEEQLATFTAGAPVTPAPSIAKTVPVTPAPSITKTATVSDGKYKNGARHSAVLNDTKAVIAELDILALDQCALWWCKVHLDELMSEDKPACYPSYKLHAKKAAAEALLAAAQ